MGFPLSSVGKESSCKTGDLGLLPGLERSPGGGHGYPLQYSCLENPMDRGAWQATVYGVARVGHDLATKPPGSPVEVSFLLKLLLLSLGLSKGILTLQFILRAASYLELLTPQLCHPSVCK